MNNLLYQKPKTTILFKKPYFIPLILVLYGIIIIAAYAIHFKYFTQQAKPVIDSPKTEMRKLPLDIKKKIQYATSSATFRVPILMYHYVEYVQNRNDKLRVLLNVDPDVFEQQVITLKNAGYTFITAKELGDVIDGKMKMPQNPILLTFDDGHWDFDTDVLPILKKYNVHATAYIISGFIGGSDFMSMQQLQDVVNSGLVDVGAHTVHHLSLKGLPLATDIYEIDESKQWLETNYHLQVVSFAYPNGSFDQQAADVVKNDGFTTAVSTIPGIEQNNDNRFFLYRLRPGYRTGQTLIDWLQQSSFQAY